MIESASDRWQEIFVLNELDYEEDGEFKLCKNVLKYPEKVREFLEQGYWWSNEYSNCYRPGKTFSFGYNSGQMFINLLLEFRKLYQRNLNPVEIYGNCFNGNMRLSNMRSILPHVDSDVADEMGVAFNLNLTENMYNHIVTDNGAAIVTMPPSVFDSNQVMTSFWSWKNKKSSYSLSEKEIVDANMFFDQQNETVKGNKWIQIDNQYGNFKMESVAEIGYNDMIIYPSHYWHNVYMKENWFQNTDRVTLTGFFAVS